MAILSHHCMVSPLYIYIYRVFSNDFFSILERISLHLFIGNNNNILDHSNNNNNKNENIQA